MINQNNIKEIKKLGIRIDHDMAFCGKSKGNKHLSRAVKIAKFLAIKEKADIKIVESGAWLHDTALPSGDDYNYDKNKKIVTKLLSSIDIPNMDKIQISECVASHEGTEDPKTLEAKIVHDADVIEKLGILGIIRHTWKLTNLNEINPDVITNLEVRMILDHIKWRNKRLQTMTAKKIGKYLKIKISIKEAKIVISCISKLASNGVITEKIANIISSNLNQKQNDILKQQLDLSYLNEFK